MRFNYRNIGGVMNTVDHLITIADTYKQEAGVEQDSTVSYRVFGDSKKLTALRGGADITLGRFNEALAWFANNWPEGKPLPSAISHMITPPEAGETSEDAA